MVRILTDDASSEPIFDFAAFTDAISNIIISSTPKFSIGIFGQWGIGKTTLMRSIEKKLQLENDSKGKKLILTVWFNAWRYELEEQNAIMALLKTIAGAMNEHDAYKKIIPTIKRFCDIMTELGKGAASHMVFNEVSVNAIETKLKKKTDEPKALQQDIVVVDAINEIQKSIAGVRGSKEWGEDSRIVVFVDDLDRCSPKKGLEVLESIKSFLDMDGIVFVVGLSYEVLSNLLTNQFKESEIKGEDYIQKIIQIPIVIPNWNEKDIVKLIETLKGKIDEKYFNMIQKHSRLIASSIDRSPREIKRFINTLIIYSEIFPKKFEKFDIETYLLYLIIKYKWERFAELFTNVEDNSFRKQVEFYLNLKMEDRELKFKELKEKLPEDRTELETIIITHTKLWQILIIGKEKLCGVGDNWEQYTRPTEIPTSFHTSESLTKMLKSGRIREFNTARRGSKLTEISDLDLDDLRDVDLSKLRLDRVIFSGYMADVNLCDTILSENLFNETHVRNIDLTKSVIDKSSFTRMISTSPMIFKYSKITNTNFKDANFKDANFEDAVLLKNLNFADANLTSAVFTNAKLDGVDFSDANLTDVKFNNAKFEFNDQTSEKLNDSNTTVLIGTNFTGAILNGVDFTGATLKGINFGKTDLTGVKFIDTIMEECDLSSVMNLDKAAFTPASIKECRGI